MSKRPLTILERNAWRRGWRWSMFLHSSLLLSIVAQALWLPFPGIQAGAARQEIVARVAAHDEPELIVEMASDNKTWLAREAESLSFTPLDLDDPHWQEILAEPLRQAQETKAVAAHEGQLLLERAIEQSIAETSRRSEAENLAALNKLSNQLTNVSSDASVAEVNGTIGRLLGTGERATAPQEKEVSGPFDFGSAQVHDVRKETNSAGQVRYLAMMIDAAGRTMEVELDEAAGASTFRTMQMVKSNPLLERVYRGVVMGVIDKFLQTPK